MRKLWLLLIVVAWASPARMQDAPHYQLGWLAGRDEHQVTLYDPDSNTRANYALDVPLGDSYSIQDGRYIFTTVDSDTKNGFLIVDLVIGTHCIAQYAVEITINSPSPLVIATKDGESAVYELNRFTCTLTEVAALPDAFIPTRAYGVQAGVYLALHMDNAASAAIMLLNTKSGDAKTLSNPDPMYNSSLSFSPDQHYLLYGDEQAYLYALETGEAQALPDDVTFPYFEGDGRYVVSSSQGSLAIWEFADGEIDDLILRDDTVLYDHNTRFSPSGHYTFYRDQGTTYTHIIDLNDPMQSWQLELRGSYHSFWSQDEQHLLITHRENETIYDYTPADNTLTQIPTAHVYDFADWLGENEDGIVFFLQVKREAETIDYGRYDLATRRSALIYSTAYPKDLITLNHSWSPDRTFLMIEQVLFQSGFPTPLNCATLLHVNTLKIIDLGCMDAEMMPRRFFWLPPA